MTLAIEARGLRYAYQNDDAVRDLDLDLAPGEILGLIGPNGAGKTTTFRLLTGDLTPQLGTARLFGEASTELGVAERARLGFVSENLLLPGWMRVGELLQFCRSLQPHWDDDLASTMCADMDLQIDRKVGALSRGQRAKLALLLATAHRPQLLLLDEPFGGLDALAREEILDGMLARVSESGCAVLIATHDLREVERIADRVALIHDGRLAFAETIDALLSRHRRVRITFAEDSAVEEHLVGEGIGLRREGRSLEFVQTTAGERPPIAPGVRCEQSPIGLEEIFVTWARHLRERTPR